MDMTTINRDFIMMLAVVGGVLVLYELLLVTPLRLRMRRLDKDARLFEQALKSVRDFATRISDDRKRLHGQMTRLEERMGQLHLRTDARPYEQAIALAEHGAEQSSLSSAFGLTRDEAELVSLLHGSRARPTARERR